MCCFLLAKLNHVVSDFQLAQSLFFFGIVSPTISKIRNVNDIARHSEVISGILLLQHITMYSMISRLQNIRCHRMQKSFKDSLYQKFNFCTGTDSTRFFCNGSYKAKIKFFPNASVSVLLFCV